MSDLIGSVIAERMNPPSSQAPSHLVRAGQTWCDASPHCYKCKHFKSNRHMSGSCSKGIIKGDYVSGDFARGDYCSENYDPVWER